MPDGSEFQTAGAADEIQLVGCSRTTDDDTRELLMTEREMKAGVC